jgi:hypothetical protein
MRARRTSARSIVFPTILAAKPRTIVSTSGSSGIDGICLVRSGYVAQIEPQAGNDAVFGCLSGSKLDDVPCIGTFARNCVVGQRRIDDGDVAEDMPHGSIRGYENHIQRNERILHPKRDWAVVVENENHAGVRRNFWAIHQAVLALRLRARNFKAQIGTRRVHHDRLKRRSD